VEDEVKIHADVINRWVIGVQIHTDIISCLLIDVQIHIIGRSSRYEI
jgi:hypothetical protein